MDRTTEKMLLVGGAILVTLVGTPLIIEALSPDERVTNNQFITEGKKPISDEMYRLYLLTTDQK